MRVLQLASHLDVGGVGTHVIGLAQALARRGHTVIVAADEGALAERLRAADIAHWRVPLHTSAEFSLPVASSARRISARLREEPVDLIHAHTRVAQVVAAWLSCRQGIPYVTTWHGFFHRRLVRRLWPCLGRLTIAISEPVAQHLREDFKLPQARIRVVPHGVDVARFAGSLDPAQREGWRRRLGLADGHPVVGTMSRLVPSKGVGVLIDSFAQVRARVPQARLLIIGDGEERGRLERRAARLGLADGVSFAGTLPEAAAALSLMDVFVFLPAVQEGFGLSLLEAMASARPIVAIRRGGGAPWVLEGTGCAVTVEPDRPDELAQAILGLLQDPARARELAAKGPAVAKDRYDFEREVEAIERVYQDCLGRGA